MSSTEMAQAMKAPVAAETDVLIRSGTVQLRGDLNIPADAKGVVLFAHGSGSSRHSPRNQFVARIIRQAGVGSTRTTQTIKIGAPPGRN